MAERLNVISRVHVQEFIPVDSWRMTEDQMIFHETKGAIIAPINRFFGLDEGNNINYFIMTPKKCYNSNSKKREDGTTSIGFREHWCIYMNYFENFYDKDHYLLGVYARIKYFIDCYGDTYTEDQFMNNLYTYIISDRANPILHWNIERMNRDNQIEMRSKYRNYKNPCLEYRDPHILVFMEASLIELMLIPLVSHFMYVKKSDSVDVKRILLRAFDTIFIMLKEKYGIDIMAKLYETITTSVIKDSNSNSQLWQMQDIRGTNTTIHSMNTVENIIMQIIPKYVYSESIVCFNFNAILRDIKFKVTDIPYEYSLIPISSSIRDDDNNSQADKFEAHMTKQNEALSIQINVSCHKEMERIEELYGPFTNDEIEFYMNRLDRVGGIVKNKFQEQLVDYLFMKEFGDTAIIKKVNNREYIILVIAAKRILERHRLFLLSEIIGGRVEKIVARKTVNNKFKLRMKMSENYPQVLHKYSSEDILENTLFGFIAKSLASEFTHVSYTDPSIDGTVIECNPELICEEFLEYALLV